MNVGIHKSVGNGHPMDTVGSRNGIGKRDEELDGKGEKFAIEGLGYSDTAKAAGIILDLYKGIRVPLKKSEILEAFKGGSAYETVKFQNQLKRDFNYADELQRKFDAVPGSNEEAERRKGMAMEELLIVEIERSDWFAGAYTFTTSKFDDIVNGTDLVLEWEDDDDGGESIKLAVDVASGLNDIGLSKKVSKSFQNHHSIKYFISQVSGDETVESLAYVPHVVLAVGADSLGELAMTASKGSRVGKRIDDRGRAYKGDVAGLRTFEGHPLRVLLVEQAVAQVESQIYSNTVLFFRKVSDDIGNICRKTNIDADGMKSYLDNVLSNVIDSVDSNGMLDAVNEFVDKFRASFGDDVFSPLVDIQIDHLGKLSAISGKLNESLLLARNESKNQPLSLRGWRDKVKASGKLRHWAKLLSRGESIENR